MLPIVPKAEFHLSPALVVGAETLKPGDDTFPCMHVDGGEMREYDATQLIAERLAARL